MVPDAIRFLQVLEQEWSLVSPAPLHLPLVARRAEVQCRGGQARLAPALLQGYALHTLLTSMGGVAPLASLHSQHPEVRGEDGVWAGRWKWLK